MAKSQSIRSVVTQAAEQQGLTAYAIAKQAELDPQTVKRFFDGKQDLGTAKLEKVFAVLGLHVAKK